MTKKPQVIDVASAFASAILALAMSSAVAAPAVPATPAPTLPAPEATVLEETYRLLKEVGEEIWPGFTDVPFPIVVVTAEREFLVGWDGPPPPGFTPAAVDPRLGLAVASRERTFAPGLAAAFPAFGPPAVVVIGTMETTGRTAARWALTLLHEHFHQLQYSAPNYHRDVEGLGLSGGDPSGMWMLNYPFPYKDQAIAARFDELAATILRALAGEAAAGEPWTALDRLLSALAPADARYLSFQLWQEGISRYVELRAAEAAAALEPGAAFVALGDFNGWRHEAATVREGIVEGLETVSLGEQRRVAFYPVGAALGMLLERGGPEWRDLYLQRRFTLARQPAGGASGPAPGGAGVEITYLANEGFLLAAGDAKVLVDALFPGIDGYPRVPPAVASKLGRAEAPFDGVDAVLATHFHRDHFGASEVARHLTASPALFVSTPDAVAELERSSDAPIEALARYPDAGSRAVVEAGDGVRVTALNLHHGRSRPEIQNLGFVVELGGLKILHVGDTEVDVGDLRPYDLASEEIDVALLPGWLLAEPSWRPVLAEIGARHLVVMHLASPDAPPSWFGSAGSLEGRIARIRELFPDAWIPTRPLASRAYLPAP